MNTLDYLQDLLQAEMMMETMYNKNMMDIINPEVRQLFTQMRDAKMGHVTQLQGEIQKIMQSGVMPKS
ncbi:MAG: spore coat protein [Clostridia bacterium]|nr:spore coat protein [Clostridia bacterium]